MLHIMSTGLRDAESSHCRPTPPRKVSEITRSSRLYVPAERNGCQGLMNVVAAGRFDLKPLVPTRFKLDQIEYAYDLFAHQRDGVLKVSQYAITRHILAIHSSD